MKRHLYIIVLIGIINFVLIACDNDEIDNIIGSDVELYLIESYETIDNTFQIDENTVITKESPLVYYSDFISYNSNNYIFEISNESKDRIDNLEHSVHGLAFALKVDNKLIYTGYFWPSYSSQSCNWVVIDPFRLSLSNELKVVLGYPGLVIGEEIQDKRNDNQILDVFRRDSKLIE